MPFDLVFLSSYTSLTKNISKNADGSITKRSYPMVKPFTSEKVRVSGIAEFYEALIARAFLPTAPCLLKGGISVDLVNEPRAGSTSTNATTNWVCLDVDNAKFSSPEEVMHALGFGDISYIVQYSASYKLDGNRNLSCHIFFTLSNPVSAPQLKAWLMSLNLSTPALESNITLSKSEMAVHWPLDITACQNDKLLYVAAPVFTGMHSPIKPRDRIVLVNKPKLTFPAKTIGAPGLSGLKQQERAKLNQLRAAIGLRPVTAKLKQVGEHVVQVGAGQIASYEVIDCGEYNRLNLNGGDSQAYWHIKTDLTYLHNFKGEPSLLLKEILPDYYADMVRDNNIVNATPSKTGDLLLAFREKRTAQYWKGTYSPDKELLEVYTVRDTTMLDHFMQGHGRSIGPFVPEWEMVFNPHSDIVLDEDNKRLNTFIATDLMKRRKNLKPGKYPTIQRVLDSAVGMGDIQEHFLNWLAVVWQHMRKPKVAWALHGDQGTGKGLLFRIIRKMFGKYAVYIRAPQLSEDFNAWMQDALFVFVDEVSTDMFVNASAKVEANLKTYITEEMCPIRRMRTDPYEVPSYTAFMFASNIQGRSVRITQGDRRINVGRYQPNRLHLTSQDIVNLDNEVEAFAHYLGTRKADIDLAGAIMQTEDRAEIQKLSMTSAEETANAIVCGDIEHLWEYVSPGGVATILDPVKADYNRVVFAVTNDILVQLAAKQLPRMKLVRDDLEAIFRRSNLKLPEGNKFTSFLRHVGINLKRIRIDGILYYGIDVPTEISNELRKDLTQQMAAIKSPHLRSVK